MEVCSLYKNKIAKPKNIARVYGVCIDTVYNILRRHDVKMHRPRKQCGAESVEYGVEAAMPAHPVPEHRPTPKQTVLRVPPDVPKQRKPRKPKTLWQRIKAFFSR